MGRKVIKEEPKPRKSTRVIKKKKIASDDEEFYEEEEENFQSHEDEDNSDSAFSDDDDEDSQQEEEEESVSTPAINPEDLAVRNMNFRERRGTKMNYLINRKKEEEQDPFWAQQGQNYFGNLDDGDNDEEDYEQSSSGRDEFDSDFDQTESQHEPQQAPEEKEIDEQAQKAKKKRQQLMRKIHAPAPHVKKTQKSIPSEKKIDSDRKLPFPETGSRYIHQVFNQEELLGEAATTQYFNWLSLKKLISIQTQKKDFARRSHHIEGPKIIYRNRINTEGKNEGSYELSLVHIRNVEDLTKLIQHK